MPTQEIGWAFLLGCEKANESQGTCGKNEDEVVEKGDKSLRV
jgi:hypothetical protein